MHAHHKGMGKDAQLHAMPHSWALHDHFGTGNAYSCVTSRWLHFRIVKEVDSEGLKECKSGYMAEAKATYICFQPLSGTSNAQTLCQPIRFEPSDNTQDGK